GYFARTAYRFGGYAERALYAPGGADVMTYALTAGLSLPTMFSTARLDLGLEAGSRGSAGDVLVRHLFIRGTATLRFRDLWSVRRLLACPARLAALPSAPSSRAMLLKPALTSLRPLLLAGVLLLAAAPAAGAQVCEGTQVYLTDNTRTNYSLGYEHYKNEAWCDALPYLRWVVETEPLFTSQGTPDDRNFRRLMDTYEAVAEMAQGDVRRAYLDSVLVVREQMEQTLAANGIAY